MATVKLPTHRELLWPTLSAIRQLGGSASNDEIPEAVITLVGLDDTQRSFRASSTIPTCATSLSDVALLTYGLVLPECLNPVLPSPGPTETSRRTLEAPRR